MKKYLTKYVSKFEKALNVPLMNKEWESSLVEYIVDVWYSMEILKNVKILKWSYNDDESHTDINDFVIHRSKTKSPKNKLKYKYIHDDRYGVLTVWIELTIANEKVKDYVEIERKVITKKMLIPIQDEDGFFFMKGKKYYMIYQLVDKSTYTKPNCITTKSLSAIDMKRKAIEKEDIDKNVYKIPIYFIPVMKKDISVLLFYAFNGLSYALSYLGVSSVMRITDEITNRNENIYFQISSKIFLEVNREIFNAHVYVQSIAGMILANTTNRFKMTDVDNKEFWIKRVGEGNIDKGRDLIISFNRLLDRGTQKVLQLNQYHKKDIYAILRWMLQHYNELRSKDTLSLNNKRLRCIEQIAALLTRKFSDNAYRIISLGNKVTMDDLVSIFNFSGNILFTLMHDSGILRNDENINDMDFFSRFKITTKGPNSLGNKNQNTIGIKNRGNHPSMLGYIDVLVCGNSDRLGSEYKHLSNCGNEFLIINY